MTWPFALIAPSIIERVAPVTRLSVEAFALGWLKLTVLPRATSKEDQFTTARWLAWSRLSVCADWDIAASPATTSPPVGSSAAERLSTPERRANKTNKKYFFVSESFAEIFWRKATHSRKKDWEEPCCKSQTKPERSSIFFKFIWFKTMAKTISYRWI